MGARRKRSFRSEDVHEEDLDIAAASTSQPCDADVNGHHKPRSILSRLELSPPKRSRGRDGAHQAVFDDFPVHGIDGVDAAPLNALTRPHTRTTEIPFESVPSPLDRFDRRGHMPAIPAAQHGTDMMMLRGSRLGVGDSTTQSAPTRDRLLYFNDGLQVSEDGRQLHVQPPPPPQSPL